ncbi:MAG: PIG-L family deacetylase [Acidimicrobiales bacterium]
MSGRARRALLSAAPIERGVNTVATVLQRRLERRAVAIGPEAHLRRTLVLAPHPDDEVLGCGAAMWHKRQAGTEVTVVVATDGRHSHRSAHLSADELAAVREEESQRACARLGVHDDAIRFLRHPERSLVERQGELRAQLLAVLEEVEPQEVLLPCGIDRLEDHRALNRAAHAALRALIGSGAPRPIAVYEYPIWLWDVRAWVDREATPVAQCAQLVVRPLRILPRLRPATVAMGAARAAKTAALAEYRSQMTRFTGEADWAVMDPRFVERFLGPVELYLEVSCAPAASVRDPSAAVA